VTTRIRTATPADQNAIEEIVADAYGPWVERIGGRPAPMDADYEALIAEGAVHVVGSDPVDALIVLEAEDDVLLVENVAVRPERQGRGLGRLLLGYAEKTARRRGLPAVRLFTHELMTDNVALYQRLGYAVTHEQPIPGGHLVHLRKELDAPADETAQL
jgi:predicted N-acetyltransferase YhbS